VAYPDHVALNTSAAGDRLSPNQLDKQRQIIEAARDVLARDGLAGCTARAVADASPLTKSAIHYYFADMDDLVEAAMAGHIEATVEHLRAAAAAHDDPLERFWAAVTRYLELFQAKPNAAVLWFDYWVDAVRRDRLDAVRRLHRDCVWIFAELLAAIPVGEPRKRAQALFRYLVGAVVQQTVDPLPVKEVRSHVADLCGLG
jgi:AcrR family transcriptional regulator